MSAADIGLAAILGFALLYAVASLWLPFGWDHGIMASIGEVMARGGLPFRDGWDMKGPMAYVPFAISNIFFGQTMWGIRVIELVILAPALYLVFRLVEAYSTDYVGAWAAVTLYLSFASAGWFFTAQPEIWVTALSVIAFYPFLMPRAGPPSVATTFLAGTLIGIVGLVKPIYLAYGLVPVVTAISLSGISVRLALRNALLIAAGAAASILAVATYLWVNGGLNEALNVHLRYTSSVYWTSVELKAFLKAAVEVLTQGRVAVSAPFVAVGLWSLRHKERLLVPMAVWLMVSLLFVLAQARFFPYHWFPVYAPYVILAAFGADALWRSAPGSLPVRIAVLGAGIVFFSQIGAVPARELYRLGGRAAGLFSAETQYDRYTFMAYTAGDQYRAGQYLRENTEPGDSIFVWGVDATARFLSGRRNATRFVFNMPLTAQSPFRAGYRAEMMQEISERPPAYIVIGLPWEMDETKGSFAAFTDFSEFVSRGYALDKSFGIIDLYRRNKS